MLKRLFGSISAIFAGQIFNIAGNVAVVPIFLAHWSTGVYGEWMTLSSVVSYFAVTDLGMSAAAGNVTTAAYATGNVNRYRYLQASALAFYIGVAFAASVGFALAMAFLPIPAWIGIRLIPSPVAKIAIWLLAATVLWQLPASQLRSIYRTTGDLASTQWFWNLQFIGSLVVTYFVLLLHGGILQLAAWGCVPTVAVTAATWFCLRRSHPELLPKLSDARFGGIRELMSPSLFFGLIMLSSALIVEGPVLLVSRSFGGTAVALLVTTRTLANVIPQAISMAKSALWPELTRLGAIGAEESLQLGHRLFSVLTMALSAAVAGALWFEGTTVISIWTKGKLTPDTWLLRGFLIALVLQTPWLSSSLFALANNRHRNLAYSYGVSSVLSLVAMALLIRPCGLLAVPLGVIVGEVFACYHFVLKDACTFLGEDYAKFALRLWAGLASSFCAAWTAGYLGHKIAVGPALLQWVEVGILTTIASTLTAWVIGLLPKDRVSLRIWGLTHMSALRHSFTKSRPIESPH